MTRFFGLEDTTNPAALRNTAIYRFCRVPFGAVSSPFLLGATVNHHLDKVGTIVAKRIKENIYVDNVLTGADTAKQAAKSSIMLP